MDEERRGTDLTKCSVSAWRICGARVRAENRREMAPTPIVERQPPDAMKVEGEDDQAQEDGDGMRRRKEHDRRK